MCRADEILSKDIVLDMAEHGCQYSGGRSSCRHQSDHLPTAHPLRTLYRLVLISVLQTVARSAVPSDKILRRL